MNSIPTNSLSERARSMLRFIHAYRAEKHYAPSTRDIARHLRTSTSVINYNLRQLERRSLLIIPRDEYGAQIAHTMYLSALGRLALDLKPEEHAHAAN